MLKIIIYLWGVFAFTQEIDELLKDPQPNTQTPKTQQEDPTLQELPNASNSPSPFEELEKTPLKNQQSNQDSTQPTQKVQTPKIEPVNPNPEISPQNPKLDSKPSSDSKPSLETLENPDMSETSSQNPPPKSPIQKQDITQDPLGESPSTPQSPIDSKTPQTQDQTPQEQTPDLKSSKTKDDATTSPQPSQQENLAPSSDLPAQSTLSPNSNNHNQNQPKLRAIGPQELKEKVNQCETKDDKATCFEVGMIYYQGRSVYGQRLKDALYFFDRSCDAQKGLGCYEAGIITANQQQYQYAFIFLEKSCNSGDLRGCKNLGILYYNGWGTPKNLYKATEIFNAGCKRGDQLACQKFYLALGNAYQESLNYAGARKNFQKACELGDQQACEKKNAIELLEKQLFYQNNIQNNVLRKNSKN